MADAMLDARQEGESYRRIEVITGQSRRRRWRAEEKARIVGESFEADANISEVARRNGVARGLLTAWRRQFAATARSKAASFVPVRIVEESGGGTTGEPDRAAPAQTRLLEKVLPARGRWNDQDRGERGARPGRAGSGVEDALDGAIGA